MILEQALELYGVKDDNWLEAKYFRKGGKKQPTVGKIPGAYSILRDLVRLCVFPSEPNLNALSPTTRASRYFLHVYHGAPGEHAALERNLKKKREPRSWLANLHKSGRHQLPADDLRKEPAKSFATQMGARLDDLSVSLDVTTLAIDPPTAKYGLYLTRIDGFVIERPAAPAVAGTKGTKKKAATPPIPARPAARISLTDGRCAENPVGSWDVLRESIDRDLAK